MEIRAVRRELALEPAAGLEHDITLLTLTATEQQDPEDVGTRINDVLGGMRAILPYDPEPL